MKVADELLTIDKAILQLCTSNFSGTARITINMNQGGITTMKLATEAKLNTISKK